MLSKNRPHPHPELTSSVKMANFPLSSMSSSSSLVVVLPAVERKNSMFMGWVNLEAWGGGMGQGPGRTPFHPI